MAIPEAANDADDARPRVGVRELRNQVSALLRRAAAGERIVVTIDGAPVAQLGPLSPDGRPSLDDLVEAGLVVAPRRRDQPEAAAPIATPVDLAVDTILAELRGSR